MTRNPEIPMAKSLTDYIFRWMGMEFVPGYRAANAPQRPQRKVESPTPTPAPVGPGSVSSETAHDDHDVNDASPDAKPFDYGSGLSAHAGRPARPTSATISPAIPRMSQSAAPDALSQQGTQMQSDAPACDVCGSITVRSGTCYKCQNCGNSMGCS
jgi:ribonucleoside-diphosphate reductase alpha chain